MAGPTHNSDLAGMFDGRLDVAAPLSDEQLREIPTKRGVFLLTAEDERPILLTTAASIRSRLRGRQSHQRGEGNGSREARSGSGGS